MLVTIGRHALESTKSLAPSTSEKKDSEKNPIFMVLF